MGLPSTVYNALFKRTSSLIFLMVTGAFILEPGLDYTAEMIYNNANKGKLWHHIENNYKSE